eukprot:1623209-Prymnesium_polylepis.1
MASRACGPARAASFAIRLVPCAADSARRAHRQAEGGRAAPASTHRLGSASVASSSPARGCVTVKPCASNAPTALSTASARMSV